MGKEETSLIIPQHIAFIMDGNGRWAKSRGLPRYLGHREACKRLIDLLDTLIELNVRYCSFFAFSTENWNRPQEEIDHLMNYLEEFLLKELGHFQKNDVRIHVSGDLSRLPTSTREASIKAMEETKNCKKFHANICLNYGGQQEIVRAAKNLAADVLEGKVNKKEIDEAFFSRYLYQPDFPSIDLLIRTSGEERLSNFMLYECAYAEFVFTKVKWPDFNRKALLDCLRVFSQRDRRYGGIKG